MVGLNLINLQSQSYLLPMSANSRPTAYIETPTRKPPPYTEDLNFCARFRIDVSFILPPNFLNDDWPHFDHLRNRGRDILPLHKLVILPCLIYDRFHFSPKNLSEDPKGETIDDNANDEYTGFYNTRLFHVSNHGDSKW
jgi:hypothetical protein